MIHSADLLIMAIILLSVVLSLASNRLVALVNIMALQGVMVSLLPLLSPQAEGSTAGALLLFSLMLAVKGIFIPWLLYLALRRTAIRREIEPIIGYHASLCAGLAIILLSVLITARLRLVLPGGRDLMLTTAITTLAAGFFLMMSRRKAITQVIGYLMLENGIFLVGTALSGPLHPPYVVEFGVLLDLLVGVMIMGIILHNINHTFDDVDTALLGRLKD